MPPAPAFGEGTPSPRVDFKISQENLSLFSGRLTLEVPSCAEASEPILRLACSIKLPLALIFAASEMDGEADIALGLETANLVLGRTALSGLFPLLASPLPSSLGLRPSGMSASSSQSSCLAAALSAQSDAPGFPLRLHEGFLSFGDEGSAFLLLSAGETSPCVAEISLFAHGEAPDGQETQASLIEGLPRGFLPSHFLPALRLSASIPPFRLLVSGALSFPRLRGIDGSWEYPGFGALFPLPWPPAAANPSGRHALLLDSLIHLRLGNLSAGILAGKCDPCFSAIDGNPPNSLGRLGLSAGWAPHPEFSLNAGYEYRLLRPGEAACSYIPVKTTSSLALGGEFESFDWSLYGKYWENWPGEGEKRRAFKAGAQVRLPSDIQIKFDYERKYSELEAFGASLKFEFGPSARGASEKLEGELRLTEEGMGFEEDESGAGVFSYSEEDDDPDGEDETVEGGAPIGKGSLSLSASLVGREEPRGKIALELSLPLLGGKICARLWNGTAISREILEEGFRSLLGVFSLRLSFSAEFPREP